jgi:YggT family protein
MPMSIIRIIDLYSWLLVISALLSWVPEARNTKVYDFITKLTDPFLNLFRRLPLQIAGLDLSVVVAIIVLNVIRDVLVRILW